MVAKLEVKSRAIKLICVSVLHKPVEHTENTGNFALPSFFSYVSFGVRML